MSWRKVDDLPLGMTIDDLPVWMRSVRREIDWAMWIAVVLCLIVAWPLLARPGLPHNNETQALIYRTVEIADNLQAGVLYPRWAQDFNYGYGSPLFNYLPPLPHYLAGLISVLFQFTIVSSVKAVFVAGIVLNGVAFFGFIRRRWGYTAGILGLMVYLFSPQILLVKPYLQGDLSGLLAMGWFWAALWALDWVLADTGGRSIAAASGALACLWLTQFPLAAVLTAVALGWVLVRMAAARSRLRRAHAGRVVLAFSAGLGGAAFFWLPAWAEWRDVRWALTAGYSDELATTIPMRELLSQPGRLDLAAINPAQTGALGLAVWVLALAAAGGLVVEGWRAAAPAPIPMSRGDMLQRKIVHAGRWIAHEHSEAAFWAAVGLVSLAMMCPGASRLWDGLPAWPRFVPRDLLLLAIGCGAVMAAQIAVLADKQGFRWTSLLVGANILAGAIALTSLPFANPPEWPARHIQPNREAVLQDELRGSSFASGVGGWLLPRSVEALPQPAPTLIVSYQDDIVDKVARDTIPAATQVDVIEHNPQSERLVVQTRTPVELTILTFNFPGWSAEINNESTPIQTDPVTGLITLQIPEGRHDVDLSFGSTPARDIGWLITFASTGLVIVVAMSRPSGIDVAYKSETRTDQNKSVLLIVALWLGACGVLPRLAPEAFMVRSAPGTVLSAERPLPRALQGGIDLLAYDLDGERGAKPGSEVRLTLYWRAFRPDLPDYQVNIALVSTTDPEYVVARAQHRHPGMIASSLWPMWSLLDRYVRDAYVIPVDVNARAGDYEIRVQVGRCRQVGMLPCDTIVPLFVRDGRGSSLGQNIMLPDRVEVRP